ncbi:MAG: carboxypeptidase regulatory-like domain-containing protein [Planctomycetes bacterium]|nr:carboxypeptidase regulatory-like domain-containing protein [Planctomycetota bacterium]
MNRFLVLLAILPLAACSREDAGDGSEVHASPPAKSEEAQPPDGYRVTSVENDATLAGRVRFGGAPPARARLEVDHDAGTCGAHEILSEELLVSADGGLAGVVVWLEGIQEGKDWSAGETILDQKGCVYHPHVAVAGVGRPIRFVNSDPVIHNVNTFPRKNPPINVSLLPEGSGRPVLKKLRLPDEIKVTCDAHKWMSAWIVVRDNPYYAVTKEDGSFSIEGLPPGSHKMVVWHESLTRIEKEVELARDQTLELDFVLEKE